MTTIADPASTSLADDVVRHLRSSLAKDRKSATRRDHFVSLALAVRDRLIDRWIQTQSGYYDADARRVYYLSLEFLTGRMLSNAMINLQIHDEAAQAMRAFDSELSALCNEEAEPGLGNGGLGRLAACFLDSAATLELPVYGYGLRYEYGMFHQRILDGFQVEAPDNWLRYGNPWEIPRPEYLYPVRFYGRVEEGTDARGRPRFSWLGGEQVLALAYDTPVPGYGNGTVNTLRLWSAKSTREFDLEHFNYGDYERAVEDKNRTETLTRILYPNDNFFVGRELRLKQQYFLVCATLQDALRRWLKHHSNFSGFADKHVFHLNDTHPALAVAELMRILVDEAALHWDEAWDICQNCFAYTNHTILPEAMEKWRVELLEQVLPRHMQIIFEINQRFLDRVAVRFPGDEDRLRRMSVIEEGDEQYVQMAHLAIIGSRAVNGVAELHSRILRQELFSDFEQMWPERFHNVTNGVTQRRWLLQCNPQLANLITARIGSDWVTDLPQLEQLEAFVDDEEFRHSWRQIKRDNKVALASYIATHNRLHVSADSLFDCQVKRIHEYKRQLLNLLHVLTLYRRLKAENGGPAPVRRTVILAGKAAPAYHTAKVVIKLAHCVADLVNSDPDVSRHLRVVFLGNYDVGLAEQIFPAADLSEQISTAGMEASGTGNMKFALNGALTIGTMDGANIEMAEQIGADNMFIFGLDAKQVQQRKTNYDPGSLYDGHRQLREVIDMIASGQLCPARPDVFEPLVESLLHRGDPFMVLADYDAYLEAQQRVDVAFRDPDAWSRTSILNCARMGKFSADRSVAEYARNIWQVESIPNHQSQ